EGTIKRGSTAYGFEEGEIVSLDGGVLCRNSKRRFLNFVRWIRSYSSTLKELAELIRC
ncbi:hypothetical protein MKX03_001373, partial [Papaver bracteatum]